MDGTEEWYLFTDTASLRQYVLDTAEGESDPRVVAEKVLASVSTIDELRVIAEACLSSWAWSLLKRPHASRVVDTTVRTFTDSNGIPRASTKQIGFIDAYTKALNARVKVGEGFGDRKRLGDCTVTDLTWMANLRREMASKNEAAASRLEKLAYAMACAEVTTVAELDRAVTENILLNT